MSDALPLPVQPNLEQYKKLAKDLRNACRSDDPHAVAEWANRWLGQRLPGEAGRLIRHWQRFRESKPGACALADAQFFIARAHGFASWPKFARHLERLTQPGDPAHRFEAAAEAIVTGDTATLGRLLSADPKLVRARSDRDHRSTLLHYVAANGIEDFRQKTPPNIVAIARMLLDAGADVNAESAAYGGRSTVLGLAATSCHPAYAGVQNSLLELLIARGAKIDSTEPGSAVNACLHNGRGAAAVYLAEHGASLNLEAAAGIGCLDVVRGFFNPDHSLKPPATLRQKNDGFAWACQFGHIGVVAFLLETGIPLDAALPHHGQTGLHWAAYGGHADIVKLLLTRGASVDFRESTFGGTPLGWALYGWGAEERPAGSGNYYETVAALVRAGATLDRAWYASDVDRNRARAKAEADPRMLASLGDAL